MFNFKDTKKVDPTLESLLDFPSFFEALHVLYQKSKIEDDIQVDSQFPYLLGHPVAE